MISLTLAPDEEMIRESARSFAREKLAPRMRDHEARGVVDHEIVREYRSLGFATMELEDATPLTRSLVLEELAAADPASALPLDGAGPALRALIELDATDLVRRITGEPELRVAFVADLAGRLEVRNGALRGVSDWTPSEKCEAVVVLRRDGVALVRERVRYTPVKPCGLAASGSARIDFDDAPIARSNADREAAARALAYARLYVAALLVGAARGSFEYASRYAQERVAFGKPIAHHQGMAFLLADMATAVDAARMAVVRAAVSAGVREAAWALAESAEQALFVGPSGVQVLGGHGFMKDHPVEKWMRDIRTLAQLAGGRDEAEIDAAALEESA